MNDSSFISSKNLSHSFPSKTRGDSLHVFTDIDFALPKGIVTSIVGPSGCGKSTLLRILSGLVNPTSGQVLIGNEPPTRYRDKHGIGFVFQNPVLFPWRNVLENVLLPFEISPLAETNPSVPVGDKAIELLTQLGLDGFVDSYPSELSGGMTQRAALARALVMQPSLLFLDEPLSAIDELTREELWIEFRKLWRLRQLSVVLVTHSIQEAVFLGDRVIVLSDLPASILSDVENSFSCDRNKALLTNPDFHQRCLQVRQSLRLSE